MPYKYKYEEYRRPPRNWSEAMLHYRPWVTETVKIYVPASEDWVQTRIHEISTNLNAGLVISANKGLANMASDIDQEPQLLFNITSAQKELQEVVEEEKIIIKAQEIVRELDIGSSMRQEWAERSKCVREYIIATPEAYFTTLPCVVGILRSIYHQQSQELRVEILALLEQNKRSAISKILENDEKITKQNRTLDDSVEDYYLLVKKFSAWLSQSIGSAELNEKFLLAEAKNKN